MGRTGAAAQRALSGLKAVRWYVESVMGDNHYQRYVEHRRRTHPGEPVMSERDYWRARYDDASPTVRCC